MEHFLDDNKCHPVAKILRPLILDLSNRDLKNLRLVNKFLNYLVTPSLMERSRLTLELKKMIERPMIMNPTHHEKGEAQPRPRVPVHVTFCLKKLQGIESIDDNEMGKIEKFFSIFGTEFKDIRPCYCLFCNGLLGPVPFLMNPTIRKIFYQLLKSSLNLEKIQLRGITLPPKELDGYTLQLQPLLKMKTLKLPTSMMDEKMDDEKIMQMNWLMPELKEIDFAFFTGDMDIGTKILKKLGEVKEESGDVPPTPLIFKKLESMTFCLIGKVTDFPDNYFHEEIQEAMGKFLRMSCQRPLKNFKFSSVCVPRDDLYILGILNKFASTVEDVLIAKDFLLMHYDEGTVPQSFPDFLPMPNLKKLSLNVNRIPPTPFRILAPRNTLNVRKLLKNMKQDYPNLKNLELKLPVFEEWVYDFWIPREDEVIPLGQVEKLQVSYPSEEDNPAMYAKWHCRFQTLFPNAVIENFPIEVSDLD